MVAKKNAQGTTVPDQGKALLRAHAEHEYAEELAEIEKVDNKERPPNWKLSPWAVCQYLMGGKLSSGFEVTPKYIGDQRLMEIAIATLATDRALLLLGVPGAAKSWVSEHLSAAVCGDSTMLIQGTAGTSEEAIRYGWNYAELLSKGPSADAVVASPLMRAMEDGKIARVEELTRVPSDVQDSLITILSEKTLPIPELNSEKQANKGFNVIATANDRDRGVNDLSSALKRRFNTVVLPLPKTLEQEVEIVHTRAAKLGKSLEIPAEPPALEEVKRIVQIFRELRSGQTEDQKTKLKIPSGTLSTAELISTVNHGLSLSAHFGDGKLGAEELAGGIMGAVVKDPVQDSVVWKEYLQTVVKERWPDLYKACRKLT